MEHGGPAAGRAPLPWTELARELARSAARWVADRAGLPRPAPRGRARRDRRALDVALLACPPWAVERPPLNLGYLAASLRAAGLRTRVWDLNVELFHRAAELGGLQVYWSKGSFRSIPPVLMAQTLVDACGSMVERCAEEVLASGAPLIGLSVTCANRPFVRHLARALHAQAPERVIVLGGPEVPALRACGEVNHFMAHHLAVGEAEQTLVELARRHLEGGCVETVPGTFPGRCLVGPGWAGRTPYSLRPPVRELDQLPFPSYEDFDVERYTLPELPFLFSRGCTARCAFCLDRTLQPGFRCRSGVHAVDEMEQHGRRLRRHVFTFNDLSCNNDLPRLEAMCREIVARGLELSWSSYAMVLPEMTAPVLQLLARSGCSDLHFGVESGSDHVLRLMYKPYRVAQVEAVLRATREAGIRTSINIVVGFPGERERDFEDTCRFLERNHGLIDSVLNLSILTILPGSRMAAEPARHGIQLLPGRDWRDHVGVTRAVRQRRLDEALALLRRLGIAPLIINRGPDDTPVAEGPAHAGTEPSVEEGC